jgi:chromosome segregation ATPase
VTQALRVARRLARENDELRSHSDLVRVLNAGLATHASVLHDRNLSLLARAREGFQLGFHTVRRLYDECDGLKADLLRVSEELETAKQAAFEGGQWKIKFDVLTETTDEQAHALQDELAQAKAENTSLRDESAQAKAEVASLKTQLASRPVAPDEHDLVPAHEVRSTRDVASSAAQEVDLLRSSLSTLEADLRRVTALLTVHAEEHQRDLTHIRELEGSVSRAESARVVADSARSEAEVAVLRVESRAPSYRRLLQESRRHGREQVRTLLGQTQRLESRVMELDRDRARPPANVRTRSQTGAASSIARELVGSQRCGSGTRWVLVSSRR